MPKQKNQHNQSSYTLAATRQKLTSRSGLLALIKVLKALQLKPQADTLFAAPGSNRGYRNSEILTSFILMLNEGARCLEDVCHLHTESLLLKLGGINKIPGADTLARWLKRHGQAGAGLVHQLNRTVIAKTMRLWKVKRVTLDIDATVILTDKAGAKWTRFKQRGFMLMVGTIAETGQVIAVELRHGNVAPSFDNIGFIKTCQALLPSGVILTRVRIDAAGYQHGIIEYLVAQGVEYVIRTPMNPAIEKVIAGLSQAHWQPLRLSDGSLSPCDYVAHCTYQMYRSKLVSRLVIQRRPKSRVAKQPNQPELSGLFEQMHYRPDKYDYRVITTNIKGLDDAQIVHEYNQRGEHCENRIKELKSDFVAGRLPCSNFAANALYVCVCALAYNAFALMRAALPKKFRSARAPTLRVRLFGLAAKIVRQGRQWQLKLQEVHRSLLSEVFESLGKMIEGRLLTMQHPLIT